MADPVEIINEARNFADSSFNSADTLVSQAVSIAQGSVHLNPPPFPSRSQAPTIDEPDLDAVGLPGPFEPNVDRPDRPTLQLPVITTPDFDSITVPSAATIVFPDAPSMDVPAFLRDAPEVSDPDVPEAPEVHFPTTPDLLELSVPDAPAVTVPAFDPTRPGAVPDDVPDGEDIMRVSYETVLPEMRAFIDSQVDGFIQRHSPEHANIVRRLEERLDSMLEGGTGLPEQVEQRLFDRARARTKNEALATEREAAEAFAARGHTLPPGALQAAVQRASEAGLNASAATSSEIYIEQARLEQSNLQFAIQSISTLRQAMLQAALQYAGVLAGLNAQALQYAQSVANVALQVYNARVQLFSTQVEYFRVQAQVYEVELRAAFAELERFQALIRVEELKGSLNSQLLQQYAQQAEIERLKVQTYSEQLRAVGVQLEYDRLRIEVFGAQVQAHTTRLQGKELEFRVYDSALRGEQSKAQVYATEVEAYRTQVGAEQTKVQANIAAAEARLSLNRTQTEIFRNEMQAYGVDVNARASMHEADLRRYAAALDKYRAEAQVKVATSQSAIENARLDFQAAAEVYRGNTTVLVEQGRLFAERIRNASGAAISGAGVYGSIASAALSAQNTMVSLSRELLDEGE